MRVSKTGKWPRVHIALLSLPVVIHSSIAPAATDLYWNVSGTGGDGIWGSGPGDKNWHVTPGSPSGNVAWPGSGDEVAVFQDVAGGTVTVFDPPVVAGIVQNGANYTITASEITLTRDASSAVPFVRVESGVLTVESPLLGSDGLLKSGTGQLVLTGDHLFTGTTTIAAGTLTLGGSLASTTVSIAAGAGLEVQSGGLAGGTLLENTGNLTLAANDTVSDYRSLGGRLVAGAGTLTSATALLGGGSVVAGNLTAGVLTSHGSVLVSGSVTAGSLSVESGTLTNTGILGNASMFLNIAGGATLVAGGAQQFAVLSTSGSGAGLWQGNLANSTVIAPGGEGDIGTLAVSGNFTNLPGANLRIDLAAGGSDLLSVSGAATFGGTLDLSQVGSGSVPTLTPIQVVQAASYSGNFSSIAEDLDGAVWFNPARGEVTVVGGGAGGVPDGTANRRSTWIALYDDVIDPGASNVFRVPSTGLQVTSGIADPTNPDLLWSLAATTNSGRLDGQVLDRLSPAPYAGLSDYAIQAGRRHEATALSAPSLVSGEPVVALIQDDKGSSKQMLAPASFHRWEVFAAADFFSVESEDALADYDLNGWGMTAGWRVAPTDQVRLAAYFAADDGTVQGSLIDADASGWSAGMIAEVTVHPPSATRVTSGFSFGNQVFDGSRGGLSATSAGWSPAAAVFSDVNVASWSGFVEIASTVYRDDRFQLIPTAGLRFATTTMDAFVDGGGAVGLAVFEDQRDSLVFELGLDGVMKVNEQVTATARCGVRQGLIDEPVVLGARFTSGSRPMRAEVDGLSGNSGHLGLGMNWRATEAIAVGFDYDAEIRTDAALQHGAALSCTWRF